MYDMKALYQAASVEEAVALRLEHPEAPDHRRRQRRTGADARG